MPPGPLEKQFLDNLNKGLLSEKDSKESDVIDTRSKQLSTKKTPPPISPVSTLLSDPLGAAAGLAGFDIIPAMAKGLGGMISTGIQGATGGLVRLPGSTLPQDAPASENALAALNLATLGMTGLVRNAVERGEGKPDAVAGEIVKGILPIDQIKSVWTGTDSETGEPLTAREIGGKITETALMGAPVVGGASKAVGLFKKGLKPPPPRVAITKTALGDAMGEGRIKDLLSPEPKSVQINENQLISATDRPAPPKISGYKVEDWIPSKEGVFGSEEILRMIDNIESNQATAVVAQSMRKLSKDPTFKHANQQLAALVQEGALSPDMVPSILKRNMQNPVDFAAASLLIGDTIRSSATFFGKGLNAISQYKKMFNKHFEDVPEAGELLKQVTKSLDENKIITTYSKLSEWYRTGLKGIRSSMVGQMATMARNSMGQATQIGVNVVDDFMADSLTALTGKVTGVGKKVPLKDYYANTLYNFTNAFHSATQKGRSLSDLLRITEKGGGPKYNELYTNILEELPIEAARLLNASSTDMLVNTVLRDGPLQRLKKSAKAAVTPGTMMDGWADTITFLNHSQEMQFRQLGFMGRLQQNLSRLGFEGMEGLERFHGILQNTKKLDDDLNFAITDAVDHSLKQTFSMGPGESTFGKAILDTYQKIPFLAGLGPYFPRFMVNQFRWINEHNPLGMLSLASKDFRKELMEQAANPKGMSKKSVQKMGQAMNGFAMWMVASYLRDSEYAGPKYYQIRTGKDEQGNEKMWDLRSYQPFTSILFFQDMMRSIGRGEAININAAELNEAVTGLRRSAEVPLLAFTDVIRNIDSTNPDTFVNSLKPFVGQFIAAPFIPLRSMLDLAGGTVSPGMAEYKDTAGNELTGPLLSNIPGAREALPDRIDPFTGQSSKTDHPVLRQLGGVSLKTVTPLDDLIQQSNLSLGDLLGNYADPEARQMVAKKIGEFLNTEVGGTTINSKLANMISTLTASASIEDRRDLIRKVYSELRGDAKRAAMKENLLPFLEDAIRSRPEGERALLREQAKKLKEKYKSSSTPK